jgi:ubiquinone/menaquinone biosynthesis C-methylase UbiE
MSLSDLHRLYFNALAGKWAMSPSVAEQLRNHLLAFAPMPGDRILDVGAGTGIVTGLLKSSCFPDLSVVPIDISERMLQQGKKNLAEHYQLATCCDVYRLPFPAGLFSAAICFSAFPHFKPLPAIRELVRILGPKGRLLVLHTQCSRKLNQFHSSLSGPVCTDMLMKADELSVQLEQHGLLINNKIEQPELYWVEASKP